MKISIRNMLGECKCNMIKLDVVMTTFFRHLIPANIRPRDAGVKAEVVTAMRRLAGGPQYFSNGVY